MEGRRCFYLKSTHLFLLPMPDIGVIEAKGLIAGKVDPYDIARQENQRHKKEAGNSFDVFAVEHPNKFEKAK